MRFRIYKNSALATFFSFAGAVLIVVGLPLLFAGVVPGIICICIGVGLSFLAEPTAERKRLKKWIKELNKKGALVNLATSKELAFELYKTEPHRYTLNYIAKNNPAAAAEIKIEIEEKKKKRRENLKK